jgi:hypothetical protein
VRWYEVQLDGTKCYREAVIGSVSDYKSEAEAEKAADSLRLEINEQIPRQQLRAVSFETLIEHYRLHELPGILKGTRPLARLAKTRHESPFRRRQRIQAICANGFFHVGDPTDSVA